ncbi:MAG: DUF2726 domain-containing protein [Steroidobacteraceae bacterium]
MKLVSLVLAVLVLTAVAVVLKPRRRNVGALDTPWPLERKPTLLSAPEQALYRRLLEALPNHQVLAQVQLLQTVRFKRGSRDASIRNRISQLSIDFLVVSPETAIVAAVELNDATHDDAQRRAADARKAHALKSAGIPLLIWSVREMPDVSTIRAAIAAASGAH